MSGDILNLLQVIFEHALTTGLFWTGAVVLAVTLTVVGLAFSPRARPNPRADADEPAEVSFTDRPKRRRRSETR